MFSSGHAAVAIVAQKAFGKHWSAKEHVAFFLGSVLPDLPVFFPGTREFFKWLRGDDPESLFGAIWRNTGYYHTFIAVRELFHDIWFWSFIILLCGMLIRKGYQSQWLSPLIRLSWSAIFCHIFVDWPTHTMRVHNYLWPLTRRPQVGITSHADPHLWMLEAVVMLMAAKIIWDSRFIILATLRDLPAKKSAAL